jgi:hypothetical protein
MSTRTPIEPTIRNISAGRALVGVSHSALSAAPRPDGRAAAAVAAETIDHFERRRLGLLFHCAGIPVDTSHSQVRTLRVYTGDRAQTSDIAQ